MSAFEDKCLFHTTDLRQKWCIDTEFRKCLIFYETLVSYKTGMIQLPR